jgi:tetratricopeptide (TPR) repeat protein
MAPRVRVPSLRVLAASALLASLAGCSVIHLGRSGAAASSTAVEPETKPDAKKAKQRSHEKPADATPLDPLAEARLRAQEQPNEPWWPYEAAALEAKAGRPADAEASLRAAIARDSAYAPALSALSRTLYEQGRHEEAIQLLAPVRAGRGTMNEGERATLLAGLALHEAALGRDADARETAALARDEAASINAVIAVRGTDKDVADKATQAAVKSAPGSAASHNNRGIALLRAADADGAEKEFLRAIELDPTRSAPYYNLAILERWYHQDAAAATVRFKQYWALSHADPDSLYAELGRGTPTPVAEGGTSK